MNAPIDFSALHARLSAEGFAFVTADSMRELLAAPQALGDWAAFALSWNDLGADSYLAARGRQRRRRHAVFTAAANGAIERQPHRAHYQGLQYNPLQGDIERWFLPIRPVIASGPSMQAVLGFCRDVFGALAPQVARWHVEVHQFRIEASAGVAGEPTPEGVHRDGVDYVLVLLIDRQNIESGTTTIHAADGGLLGSFTLAHPFDAALVDDARVSHGVTAVTAFDPQRPAHRDVLVVTFKAFAAAAPAA